MKAPKIKTRLASSHNYGGWRDTKQIRYIVIHYTANDGDSDEGNANYFASPHDPKTSAHYFVDDDSITRSVPDDRIAYAVGGKLLADHARTGGGKLYGKATNVNTLNIEMCDSKKDGVIKAQEATIARTIELVRWLMDKYHTDINHVIRHFDVNGKHCPAYLMDAGDWAAFKARILGYKIGGKYRTTKPCYLRLSPAGKKLAYKDAPDHIKAKSTKKGGKVSFKKGATFTLAEIAQKNGDTWGRMKSGYWVPLHHKFLVRALLVR